jgi:NAD+ synthetase
MLSSMSKKYNLPIFYNNQVGGNDDIVFDGNSLVINEAGLLIAHSKSFEEEFLTIPIEDTLRFAPGYNRGIEVPGYESDAQFFTEQAICGIRSYVKKCGFKGVVIGESGGIDSAVVTALAVMALGFENVYGITMPSKYSSEGSYMDSEDLCNNFGVKLYTYPIKNAFETILTPFNDIFPEMKPGLMEENLQARIRGQLLMSFSNRYGCLVLSTGNKSELSVGYCTVGGDMMGGMAPISDLYKTEVYAVAKYINIFYGRPMIPPSIITKEPSAELAPDQRDTDSLPPYPILDAILKVLIEGEVLPEDEFNKCDAICAKHRDDVIKIRDLMRRAEFKRRQAAITLKMHHKAFGYGRRIPIAQKWNGE